MLERGIVCLVSGALALVFPVTVMCCPWVLSLRAVVIRHSLHVMSSVGRAQPGCPWAVLVLAVWRYQYPCGILQPHNDSEADMKSCGHSYSVQVSVWVDWHTPIHSHTKECSIPYHQKNCKDMIPVFIWARLQLFVQFSAHFHIYEWIWRHHVWPWSTKPVISVHFSELRFTHHMNK